MGWMTMDSSSDEDEPSAPPASSPAPVPAPEAAPEAAAAAVPPPRKRAKVQEPAEPTHEEDKNTAAAAAADDDEEVQALYRRYVERFARQGLSPSEAHARLTKTFGSVLTLEEVASLFKAAESSQSSSSLSSSKASTASTASTAPATSNNGAAEEKHMGRPADAEQQRVILETVEHNPRVSLRTVAAAVGCSKSQVARVLALNGFQRNKGRVGEWQRAPLSPQAVAAAAAQARAVAAAAARAWRAGKREERLLQHQRQAELARQLERE